MKRIGLVLIPPVILALAHLGIPAATAGQPAGEHGKMFADCAKA